MEYNMPIFFTHIEIIIDKYFDAEFEHINVAKNDYHACQ